MKTEEIADNLYKNEKGNIEITPETFILILKRFVKENEYIERNTITSKEDAEMFFDVINNPPPPNKNLMEAKDVVHKITDLYDNVGDEQGAIDLLNKYTNQDLTKEILDIINSDSGLCQRQRMVEIEKLLNNYMRNRI